MGKSKGARYTISKKKNMYSFTYSGDLGEAVSKAKKDLQKEKDNPDIVHWLWIKAMADKLVNAHYSRIKRIQLFIECAEEELEKHKVNGGATDGS